MAIVSGLSAASAADAPTVSSNEAQSPITLERTQASLHQRAELVEYLTVDLGKATTPEERAAVLEQYRASVASLTPVPHVATDQPKRPVSESIAEMKAKMPATPEGQARAASLEATWSAVESIRIPMGEFGN